MHPPPLGVFMLHHRGTFSKSISELRRFRGGVDATLFPKDEGRRDESFWSQIVIHGLDSHLQEERLVDVRIYEHHLAEGGTDWFMIPFPDSKAKGRFYSRALNFYICSCSKGDERLVFAEVAALVDQYPIGQSGVDRGPTAKQSVPDALGANIGEKAGRGDSGRLVNDMQDGHGVDVHDIHHDPLVEAGVLGTKRDAEAGRLRLDSLAGITALRYIPKDKGRLWCRILRAGLP